MARRNEEKCITANRAVHIFHQQKTPGFAVLFDTLESRAWIPPTWKNSVALSAGRKILTLTQKQNIESFSFSLP